MLLVVLYKLVFHSLPPRRFVNRAPSGLCGFAVAKFILSMVNEGATSILIENIAVDPDLFYSGFTQLLADVYGELSQ